MSWIAFLSGLPNGVMKLGVREFGVLFAVAVSTRSSGFRDKDGELYWDCIGGAETPGDTPGGGGVLVVRVSSTTSPMFLYVLASLSSLYHPSPLKSPMPKPQCIYRHFQESYRPFLNFLFAFFVL